MCDAVALVTVGPTFGLAEQSDVVIVPHRAQAGAGKIGKLSSAPAHRHSFSIRCHGCHSTLCRYGIVNT
ncbi:Uncharacterised protein [Mycobacteroides abscessus subsp. abscessus]|nr:Uncharacterised protein [Mycobacteroides abscessus subsp. abscessus]